MKNLKMVLFSFLTIANVSFSTEPVTLGKVAELSCHRLERLVILGKIEESFLTKLNTLQISRLTQSNPTDPAFKVIATQYPGADGSANQIDLMMDANGKGIAQTLKPGPEAQNSPVWSDKDAASLVENSLHYILETGANNPDVKPFNTALTILTLKQVTNSAGEKVARVEMQSSESGKVLEITLKEDGTIESTNILN